VPVIDELMPSFDVHTVHETVVRAPRPRVMQAVREVTPDEIRFFRLLTWLRGFRRKRLRSMGIEAGDRGVPLLELARRGGFVELTGPGDREVVLGVVGRFWRPSGGRAAFAGAPGFLAFAEPGFAKALIDFRISDEPDGRCRVRTETRIRGVDAAGRRAFKAYWFLIHAGSALIRRMWLRAVRRRAEGATRP
jgi:hypothetical protein